MLFERHIGHDGRSGFAIWRIDETEAELLSLLHDSATEAVAQRCAAQVAIFRNEGRRKEWLAVRVLLALCLGCDKEIAYSSHGAPELTDHSLHISISHTRGFAALAWHQKHSIGIDIEQRTDKVLRVVSRFVNQKESEALSHSGYHAPDGELILWTAKEALYKTVNIPQLDCQQQLTVCPPPAQVSDEERLMTNSTTEGLFTAYCSETDASYILRYAFFPQYVLTIAEPIIEQE